MEFEDILRKVGEFGTYQKRLVYFYLIPTTTIFAFYCMNTFFMLSAPDAWCHVPALEGLSATVQQQFSRPPLEGVDDARDSCHYYERDYDQLIVDYNRLTINDSLSTFFSSLQNANSSKAQCSKWNFDKTNFDTTAVTEVKEFLDVLRTNCSMSLNRI